MIRKRGNTIGFWISSSFFLLLFQHSAQSRKICFLNLNQQKIDKRKWHPIRSEHNEVVDTTRNMCQRRQYLFLNFPLKFENLFNTTKITVGADAIFQLYVRPCQKASLHNKFTENFHFSFIYLYYTTEMCKQFWFFNLFLWFLGVNVWVYENTNQLPFVRCLWFFIFLHIRLAHSYEKCALSTNIMVRLLFIWTGAHT